MLLEKSLEAAEEPHTTRLTRLQRGALIRRARTFQDTGASLCLLGDGGSGSLRGSTGRSLSRSSASLDVGVFLGFLSCRALLSLGMGPLADGPAL